MKLHIGTSGYAYKEWKPSFYPKDLPAAEMLPFYAGHFDTVEINSSFYRLPKPEAVEAWAAQVPPHFMFAFKSPQQITHFQRLKDAGKSVGEFLKVTAVLKNRLGPLLFQLPGNFKKDASRLRDFLALLPRKQRIAFEFRHESWLDQEIYDLLQKYRIALCIAEAEDSIKVPLIATAGWGYLRLRNEAYTAATLKQWAKQIRAQSWSDAFIYFKHEDTGRGPKFAKALLQQFSKIP